MLHAVILAAGDSTRMGSPKAVLPDPDGHPFVTRIVRSLHAAGIAEVLIVTGHQHDAIVSAVVGDDVQPRPIFARNPDPSRGQLSSLWVAMETLSDRQIDGLLMTLVDVPLIAPDTIRAVVEAWRVSRAPVVRPAVGPRRGHPVIFDGAVFEELRNAPLDRGAKAVVHAHAAEVIDVPVADPGCIFDVDTPADYERLNELR